MLDRYNTKKITIELLARIQSNKNFDSLWVGMRNGTANLRDSLGVSYKAKYTLTVI